jgi:hypothetical protein
MQEENDVADGHSSTVMHLYPTTARRRNHPAPD